MNKIINKLHLNFRLTALLPYIIGVSLFIITPVILLVIKSSSSDFGIQMEKLGNRNFWYVLYHSIWLGLVAALISLFLTFPFALLVAKSKSKTFKIIALMLIISPLFIFTVAKVFSLKVLLLQIFSSKTYLINNFVMIIGMVYLYMPFMVIPIYSVISNMPKSLTEASNDLGYNNVSTLFKVIIPYSLKAIFSGLAVVFMLSTTTLVISETLIKSSSSGTSFNMIGNQIDFLAKDMMNPDSLEAPMGATMALITVAIMMAVYGCIYALPILIRKYRGGVDV